MTERFKVRRALISVSDKDGLVEHGQTTQTLGLDAVGIAAATRTLVGQAESS